MRLKLHGREYMLVNFGSGLKTDNMLIRLEYPYEVVDEIATKNSRFWFENSPHKTLVETQPLVDCKSDGTTVDCATNMPNMTSTTQLRVGSGCGLARFFELWNPSSWMLV